jgi:hypothetical protein
MFIYPRGEVERVDGGVASCVEFERGNEVMGERTDGGDVVGEGLVVFAKLGRDSEVYLGFAEGLGGEEFGFEAGFSARVERDVDTNSRAEGEGVVAADELIEDAGADRTEVQGNFAGGS